MRSFGSRCLSLIAAITAITAMALVNPAFAAEKPPLAPDQDAPLVVQSKVSAVLSFSARALAEELDRAVPRRLASFDDQLTTCGHRRGFFRRQVDVQCVVTGYIERTASHLSARRRQSGGRRGQAGRLGLRSRRARIGAAHSRCRARRDERFRRSQTAFDPRLDGRFEFGAELPVDRTAHAPHFRQRHSDRAARRAANSGAEPPGRRHGRRENASDRCAAQS